MGVKWTEEQQQVIDLRDHNILVSAAAGSGKTAVLVERIIARLTRDANPYSKDYNDPQLLPVCDPGVFSHDRSGSWIPYCGRRRIKAFEAGRDERASGSKI